MTGTSQNTSRTWSRWLMAVCLVLSSCTLPGVGPGRLPGASTPGDAARPAAAPGTVDAGQGQHVAAVADPTIRGTVRFPEGRSTQAVLADVANGATITLYDATSTSVATGKTGTDGSFSLSLSGFSPAVNGIYLLEASKGLNNQAPGTDAARIRTYLKWTGSAYLSISNGVAGGAIVLDSLTTAVAIMSALDPTNVAPGNTMGKVNGAVNPSTFNAAPAFTGHPDSELVNLATDIRANLTGNFDPVASAPALVPSVSSVLPSAAAPGALVQIQGNGFSPLLAGNTVTFNGQVAQVLVATPTQIVAVVPTSATSGTLTIATGRGSASAAGSFSILSATAGSTALSLDGFTPTFGRAGTDVTLSGNFGSGATPPTVTFNSPVGPAAAEVQSWNATSMQVTVPVGSTPGSITVQVGRVSSSSVASFNVWQGDLGYAQALPDNQSNPFRLPYGASGYGQAHIQNGNKAFYVIGGTNGASYSRTLVYPILADGRLGRVVNGPDLATSVYYMDGAVAGNWLYVFGGYNTAQGSTKVIQRLELDSVTGLPAAGSTWQSVNNLSTPRSEVNIIFNPSTNTFYVIGGYNNRDLDTYERWTFNPANGNLTYVDQRTLSGAGAAFTMRYTNSFLIGSGVTLVGGYSNATFWNGCVTLPIQADGTLGNGVFGTAPGNNCFGAQSFRIGNEIYVVNGYTGTDCRHATVDPVSGQVIGSWFQDAGTIWSAYLGGQVCVAPNNFVYALGGYGAGSYIQQAQVIPDSRAGSRTTIRRWSVYGRVDRNTYGSIWLTFGPRVWQFGGNDGSNCNTSTYYVTGTDGTWGPAGVGPSTTFNRYASGHAVVEKGGNTYLYLIGGNNGGDNTVERATVNMTTGEVGPFAVMSGRLVNPSYWATTAVVGNYVYVIGGYDSISGNYLRSMQRAAINADGSLGTWEHAPSRLPHSYWYGGGMAVIKDWVYLIGGSNGPSTHVWRARVAADGTIGGFDAISGLNNALWLPCISQIGNYLYVLGDKMLHRAFIYPDGTLGTFEYRTFNSYNFLEKAGSVYGNNTGALLTGDTLFMAPAYGSGTEPCIAPVR